MNAAPGDAAFGSRSRGRVRRAVCRLSVWWTRAFVAWVVVGATANLRWWVVVAVAGALFILATVRPRGELDRDPIDIAAPVRGTWVALNSPGSRVPSHGVRAYGQAYAIDILVPADVEPADGPHPTIRVGWLAGACAETFPSYGQPVHAMGGGTVVAVRSGLRDHRARNTWLGVVYLLVEGFVRELGGVGFVLGNHVIVDHGDHVWAVYAHLRRGSVRVRVGDQITSGEILGDVGSSGNTSEPHLHVQLVDAPVLTAAAGIPFQWTGVVARDDVVAPRYGLPTVGEGLPGLPGNGRVFDAEPAVTGTHQ